MPVFFVSGKCKLSIGMESVFYKCAFTKNLVCNMSHICPAIFLSRDVRRTKKKLPLSYVYVYIFFQIHLFMYDSVKFFTEEFFPLSVVSVLKSTDQSK